MLLVCKMRNQREAPRQRMATIEAQKERLAREFKSVPASPTRAVSSNKVDARVMTKNKIGLKTSIKGEYMYYLQIKMSLSATHITSAWLRAIVKKKGQSSNARCREHKAYFRTKSI